VSENRRNIGLGGLYRKKEKEDTRRYEETERESERPGKVKREHRRGERRNRRPEN
jgi:hypothetical protein